MVEPRMQSWSTLVVAVRTEPRYSYRLVQTLFFNQQSLDLILSDLSKSEPTVSPDKPMGQLWAASSSVFEAQSLTNSEKSSGFV